MKRGDICIILAAALLILVFTSDGTGQHTEELIFYSIEFSSNVMNNYHVCSINMTISNPNENLVETRLDLEIPEGAMLTKMILEKDNKTYVSRIEKKEAAVVEYNTAVESNETAALVEFQNHPDSFSLSIGVSPGSSVMINIQYGEIITKYIGYYDLIVPLDIVSNYPDYRHVRMDARIRTLMNIQTLDHSNSTIDLVEKQWHDGSIQFSSSIDSPQTGDLFSVKYSTKPLPANGIMDSCTVNGSGYFMHVFCPQVETIGDYYPKDIIFVLDRSGSMEGDKIETVKRSFENIIGQIDEGDSFNIVHFSDLWTVYSEKMVKATTGGRYKAASFISNIFADGGTDINNAMLGAIDLFNEESYKIPIIILLSDGDPTSGVTNTNTIRGNIRDANMKDIVIHTLGYGDDHDSDFLTALALENDGMYRHIRESTDAEDLMEGHYRSVSNPLLKDLRFNYSSGTSDVIPDSMSILFEGSEAVILGRYGPDMNKISTNVTGNSMDSSQYFKHTFTVREEGGPEFISRLWAHRKIELLFDRLLVEGANVEIEDEIASLGMNYSFVTPYTSMILVLHNEVENGEENETIPEGYQYQHEYDQYDEWEYDNYVYCAPAYDMDGTGNNVDTCDSDLDGMMDSWEAMYLADPLMNDADADPDNDGFTNLQEHNYNTNPNDPRSHPAMGASAPADSEVEAPFPVWIFAVPIILALFIIAVGGLYILIRERKFDDFEIFEE